MPRFVLEGWTDLEKALGIVSDEIQEAWENVANEFLPLAIEIVIGVFTDAAESAGSEAFPIEYIPSMLAAAEEILIPTPGGILVDTDQLGTWDDLAEGFHYGAALDGGGQVDLPWFGGLSDGGLKNDVLRRYQIWLHVLAGDTYHKMNFDGKWEETIEARLDAWGNRAPQWLLLQYGQEEWAPTISPYPIRETIQEQLTPLFYELLSTEVERILSFSRFDNFAAGDTYVPAEDVRYESTGRGSKLKSKSSGKYVKGVSG